MRFMTFHVAVALVPLLAFSAGGSASAASAPETAATAEDVVPAMPFKEGDVIGMDQIDKIRDYIPKPFWENRDFFFYEGMKLKIGPFYKDYPVSEERKAANAKFGGQARIGRDDSLENYTMGKPFPEIDPSDPYAGAKHAWNYHYRHDALEGKASFYFSYWDNGEALPLSFQGSGWAMRLANRPDHMDRNGDIFNKEKRMGAGGVYVAGPPDFRGIRGLGYAYKAMDAPRDKARDLDIWVYIPDLRRVRRISGSTRTDPVAGTDMIPEDSGGFTGVIPQFHWKYVGEVDLLAPIDTRLTGYPYSKDESFGPSGFSLGNDEWQLRHAIILDMFPKEQHPYKRKRLWVDKQTYTPLFAAAYDRHGELWKLIYMNNRWSEREDQPKRIRGINTFLRTCNIVVNIQIGTGVRIETFDVQPTRLRRGQIRKLTDIGRLNRGH
ncbi:MAG: DUF1329 domain-containing protein [Myxococcota bacterium]